MGRSSCQKWDARREAPSRCGSNETQPKHVGSGGCQDQGWWGSESSLAFRIAGNVIKCDCNFFFMGWFGSKSDQNQTFFCLFFSPLKFPEVWKASGPWVFWCSWLLKEPNSAGGSRAQVGDRWGAQGLQTELSMLWILWQTPPDPSLRTTSPQLLFSSTLRQSAFTVQKKFTGNKPKNSGKNSGKWAFSGSCRWLIPPSWTDDKVYV